MNKIMLIGRLTKDPELRYTQSGSAVASFTLAVNRRLQTRTGNGKPISSTVLHGRNLPSLLQTTSKKASRWL